MAQRFKHIILIIFVFTSLTSCAGRPYSVKWQKSYFDGALGSGTHSSLQGSGPVLGEDTLYMGTLGGAVLALDRESARPIWRAKHDSIFEAPAVLDEDRLYIGSLEAQMLAIDRSTGKTVWSYAADAEVVSQAKIIDDLVIFSSSANTVVALKKESGDFSWRFREDPPERLTVRGSSSIAVNEKSNVIYVGFSEGALVALNKNSGQVIWRKPIANEGRYKDVDGTPLVIDDKVIAAAVSGPLVAFRSNGDLLWTNEEGKSHAHVNHDGKTLYVMSTSGHVLAVNADTGKTIWSQKMHKAAVPTTSIVQDDKLVVGLSNGNVVILNKTNGEELWRYFLADRVMGKLVPLTDGFLAMDGSQTLFRFKY